MTKSNLVVVLAFMAGLVALGISAGCSLPQGSGETYLSPVEMGPLADATGFTRAESARALVFPTDHGPHLDFQTEWWYYTGNLETAAGRHFGYQLTFFRRALMPPEQREERPSQWAAEHVYLAHFALTDVEASRHRAFERLSRGAAGLAGAEWPPYRVWLEDWEVREGEGTSGTVQLRAEQEDIAVDLALTDLKGPVLQGDEGYSRKGPEPGNASHYYSRTRLRTVGTVEAGGQMHQVKGWSWMDHEFSTTALGPDQVGWDWFALQLDDGSELMVYQIRRSDGSIDSHTSGTFIDPGGAAHHLTQSDFAVQVLASWRSPHSAATYPSLWTIGVPGRDIELRIEPYVADQELNASYTYWEGAVRIRGVRSDEQVTGSGYVELTGYADSMQGQF